MKNQKGSMDLTVSIIIVIVVLASLFVILPVWNAWRMEKKGEGQMRYANMERQAMIAQAEAERDSAALRAEAIEIIGEMVQKYPEYREQEFIGAFATCLEKGCASQIIYVPTEANIPIIEASRLQTQ